MNKCAGIFVTAWVCIAHSAGVALPKRNFKPPSRPRRPRKGRTDRGRHPPPRERGAAPDGAERSAAGAASIRRRVELSLQSVPEADGIKKARRYATLYL